MTRPREIGYTDELLADGSVHRSYEDGRQEWRRRGDGGVVHWNDDQGGTGTDELLGQRIIKRTLADGTVSYGRDIGYGRTVWQRGDVVMVNRTSFGGRVGAVLAAIGVAGLAVTAARLPPAHLSPQEEDELRRQQAASQAQASSNGGVEIAVGDDGSGTDGDRGDGADADWDGGAWDGGDDGWSDDDFG